MNDQAKMGVTWASPLQQARNAANEKPKREWQGLTDEEIWELVQKTPDFRETVAAVEAKLKAKNG